METPIPFGPSPSGLCGPQRYSCAPDAIGSDWVEFQATLYHSRTRVFDQSTITGAQGTPALSAARRLDLSSPTLTKPVCRPLSISGQDQVAYFGSYVVVRRHLRGRLVTPYTLYRCGTHVRERPGNDAPGLLGNGRIIAWWTSPRTSSSPTSTLTGLFLPSRQRFTLVLASAFQDANLDAQVTSRRLFINASAPTLAPISAQGAWAAALPTPPPANNHAGTAKCS